MISWHRYYDPSIGRYITTDPIGLDGGMNLYAYVEGDPVNAIDPWGLTRTGSVIGGAIGSVAGGWGGSVVGGAIGF
jgi:uncharacterized protein RhaS with RHS repeats